MGKKPINKLKEKHAEWKKISVFASYSSDRGLVSKINNKKFNNKISYLLNKQKTGKFPEQLFLKRSANIQTSVEIFSHHRNINKNYQNYIEILSYYSWNGCHYKTNKI